MLSPSSGLNPVASRFSEKFVYNLKFARHKNQEHHSPSVATLFRDTEKRWTLCLWMQNICEPWLRYSKTGRDDGNGKGGERRLMRCRLNLGWLATTCVFVTVNEARRYLATGIS
jgi:hypothetical protein